MAKKVRKVGTVGKPKSTSSSTASNTRKRVVGGTGIMPGASYGSLAGRARSDVSNTGAMAGRARSDASNVGSLSGRAKSDASNVGSLEGVARSDVAYKGGIPKSQMDNKAMKIAETLEPFKQKSLQSLSKLQELSQAINDATSMEEINAINEQIKAFQLEQSNEE